MRLTEWLRQSDRWKHLAYAIPCGMVGTVLFAAGLAVGMEYKDKAWGGSWDWADLWLTVLGGAVGNAVTIAAILLTR